MAWITGSFRGKALAALVVTIAAITAGAEARVGVTSAAEGDPLGKPPAEAERILRIGVDIQANEVVTTQANDRAHLVFLDGTSITIGPNSRLTIDSFVYDPNSKQGSLALSAGAGILRIVGGKISKTQAITINTPSSNIGVRGGIAVIDVQPAQTRAAFLFGRDMTVSAQSQTQTVTRPGYQVIVTAGAAPAAPIPVPPGALAAGIGQLEGRTGSRSTSSASNAAAAASIVTGTRTLANTVPATTPTSLTQTTSSPSGGSSNSQSTGWQQWNGGVGYNTPSAFNPIAQMPLTGSANYNGTFDANSTNGSVKGNFSMLWNFSSLSGSFTLVSTTAANPGTGSGTLRQNGSGFSGPFTVVNSNSLVGSGTLQGSFVTTSSGPAGGVSGSFSGTSASNSGSITGTFKGTR